MTNLGRQEFTVKQGNRRILQVVAQRQDDTGKYVPLATDPGDITSGPHFTMALEGADEPKVSANGVIAAATPELCVLQYTLTETDLDTVGVYRAEFYVQLVNGERLTIPTDGYLVIRVIAALPPPAP